MDGWSPLGLIRLKASAQHNTSTPIEEVTKRELFHSMKINLLDKNLSNSKTNTVTI